MFAYRSILREAPRPAVVRESPRAPWLAVGVVCVGAFMGQLDTSIVTITFPDMERDFVAGRYLLPRTRQFSRPERFDWPGTLLLAAWTSALLLVLSAASGLSLPAWTGAPLGALALTALTAFIRREMTAPHPLIPVWLLRSASLARGLAGAACGYLVLFGPLVLIPQLLGHGLGSEARTGLVLSALPLGFGLAAVFGDVMLPRGWTDSQHGFAGAALTCTVMAVSVLVPVTVQTVLPQLALAGLGLGLGLLVPANNTVIMRSAAGSAASLLGGLVSLARGIGTSLGTSLGISLGISLMALALHLSGTGHGYAGSTHARPAFIVLAVAVAAATAAALALGGRAQARGPAGRLREADPSGGFS